MTLSSLRLLALGLAALLLPACRVQRPAPPPRVVTPPPDGAVFEAHAASPERQAVEWVLDDLHRAAAEPDGERYFGHLADGAVFYGTDAAERWSRAEFQEYAASHFDAGRGWTYVPTERHVFLGPAGDVAWFDERLRSASYGEVRGSGVLVRQAGDWRIAQYNLSFPVPNELSKELVERIGELDRDFD
jgi:hypothetical protein